MNQKICRYCGKPVTLVPSATERARKYGGTPQEYIDRFPDHSQCVVEARSASTRLLMERHRAENDTTYSI